MKSAYRVVDRRLLPIVTSKTRIVWHSDWDYGTVFTVSEKDLEPHCFHCFGRIWKLIVFIHCFVSNTLYSLCLTGDFVTQSSKSASWLRTKHQDMEEIWKLTVCTVFTVLEESGSSLFSLFLLFWKNLEAHCFHFILTDSPDKQFCQWYTSWTLQFIKNFKLNVLHPTPYRHIHPKKKQKVTREQNF